MYDGRIDSPYALATAIALLAGFPLVAVSLRRSLAGGRGEPLWSPLEAFGAFSFAAASALTVLNVVHHLRGGGFSFLFGSAFVEDGLVEWLTSLSLASVAFIAGRAALDGGRTPAWRAAWGALAAATVFVLLEENSYGQHWIGWRAEGVFAERNLQQETNLHNFVSPRLYDPIYVAVAACALGACLLALFRPALAPKGLREAVLAFGRSRWGVPLAVAAAVVLTHEAFEELAEYVTAAAVFYAAAVVSRAQAQVGRRAGVTISPAG